MQTLLCLELLVQQEREGLSEPIRTRTVMLPNYTNGKHLECPSGHKIHLGGNGETWPCDCYGATTGAANLGLASSSGSLSHSASLD